ncbi:hypothetical protein [Pseudomonas graminis]|uniref:hypothetical protein n=1 Tax=Pseudomonas graminis TaxID=158627 RepID=UPI003C162509
MIELQRQNFDVDRWRQGAGRHLQDWHYRFEGRHSLHALRGWCHHAFRISTMAAKVTGGLLGNHVQMTTGRKLLLEKLPQILNRVDNSLLVEHAQNSHPQQ